MSDPTPLRLGVSACLMGEPVRFDTGHKRDPFLTDTLSRWVEWVKVCPEMGMGLGTPRPSMRLVGSPEAPRLITNATGADHTAAMLAYATKEVDRLKTLQLSGFILKSKSPSCGMERVRVYNEGMPSQHGVGLFARILMEACPLMPVEEEGRLHDPPLREAFIEQVFTYARWQQFTAAKFKKSELIHFHAAHKYLILAHSPKHYTALGQLVAQKLSPTELCTQYGQGLMEALRVRASVRKHCNVLQHVAGFLKKIIDAGARAHIAEVVEDYRKGHVPLIVPITLLRHYVRLHNVEYLADQIYLAPTPKELMLRNHA